MEFVEYKKYRLRATGLVYLHHHFGKTGEEMLSPEDCTHIHRLCNTIKINKPLYLSVNVFSTEH